jgi:hypothetical protein
MWFVFPQLRRRGHSRMATFYGIASLHEAGAYFAHPVLGPRLELCTRTVLELESGSLNEIFGSPDDVKFQSLDDVVRRRGGRSGERFLPSARSLVPRSPRSTDAEASGSGWSVLMRRTGVGGQR